METVFKGIFRRVPDWCPDCSQVSWLTMKCILLLISAACVVVAEPPNVQQIVERSCTAMNGDWKAIPQYSWIERDVESKHGHARTEKTFRVLMLEGSTYNELIAINGQPLSRDLKAREEKKRATEIQKRNHESPAEHNRRVAKFQKERHDDHELMQQMTKAFDFTMVGEDVLHGHKVWVLNAAPNPAYVPANVETKVLLGMAGRLWVEQEHYHWVKVEAEVTKPVSLYGVLAKVKPGTRFQLEQAPVAPGVWLPSHFSTDVSASALGFFDESSTDDESYRDYRPMSELAQLVH
jgi:hypothetical protein